MTRNGLSVLAVVPARGGSKSIPRKNLCLVGGMSLLARAARVARELEWLDARVLSTDDDEMAEEGRRNGLDVPFRRPDSLAGDTSTSADMWRHAWLQSEEHYQKQFDVSVLLEPTSPLRTPDDVDRTVRTLLEKQCGGVATVSPTPAHFTPQKMLTVSGDGTIEFYVEGGSRYSLRQSIPKYYHRNGLCYAVTRRHLVEEGLILERNAAAVIVERPVVNIDDPFELELAEWLLSRESSQA
jgi:CMP-N-acetylneuraminic acid synthetase